MSDVLITGATGFIGSRLARRLAGLGHRVHAIVRPTSSTATLEELCPRAQLHVHDGSCSRMREILDQTRPAAVFHLASLFLPSHTSEDVAPLIRSNIEFGAQLLDAMAAGGVRVFVNAGTASQHVGDAAYSPATLYAATKQAFEAMAKYYVDGGAVDMITLKLFDTYGPGDTRRKIIPLLARVVQENSPLEMSPGMQLIDLVYIDDVAEAFVQAAQMLQERGRGASAAEARDFAVTSGQPRPLREIVAEVEAIVGRPLPIRWGARPYRAREIMRPWSRGVTLPGWTPRVGLAEGLRRTLVPQAQTAVEGNRP